jgi:hypothetical protein
MGCVSGKAKVNGGSINLDSFEMGRVLGEGGFGIVKCVTQNTTNTIYAMKTLNKIPLIKHADNLQVK